MYTVIVPTLEMPCFLVPTQKMPCFLVPTLQMPCFLVDSHALSEHYIEEHEITSHTRLIFIDNLYHTYISWNTFLGDWSPVLENENFLSFENGELDNGDIRDGLGEGDWFTLGADWLRMCIMAKAEGFTFFLADVSRI